MDTLPLHLLDEILFKLDPKSLAKMRCTNTSIKMHISYNPSFKIEYFSRLGSSLLHISRYGSNLLCFHPYGYSRSFRNKIPLQNTCKILGYCSGLLLLSIDGLCVANPLTNKFRFLDYNPDSGKTTCVGFAVDHIDPTTQRFHIVFIIEQPMFFNLYETTYQFEIITGYSWGLSRTTLTCYSSNLKNSKPVYLNGYLHWLREDGSIIAFNPVTEEVVLLLTNFNQEQGVKVLLSAADNCLQLIGATEKVIYFFTLGNDFKWIFVKQIFNKVVVHQSMPLLYWNVYAYDGKCLVVMTINKSGSMIHGYDLRAKEWRLVGWIPGWCDANRDFFLYKPSWSSVIGLLDHQEPDPFMITNTNPERISSLKVIMSLVNYDKFCI